MVNSNDPIFLDSMLKVTAKTDLNIENDLNIPDNTDHQTIEELLQNNEQRKKE